MWLFQRFGITLMGLALLAPQAAGADTVLVNQGRSDYVIVHGPEDKDAAADLSEYLRQISGAVVPIQPAGAPLPEKAVVVGAVEVPGVMPPAVTSQGFFWQTAGPRLILRGGSTEATRWAVFALLEERLGCRFFAPGAERVPKAESIRLPLLNEKHEPAAAYRRFIYADARDRAWQLRNRVGGAFTGEIAHNLYSYLPPDKHFADHPDWYPMRDGQRTRKVDQFLCFTNEEMIRELTRVVIERMAKLPDDSLLPVGQGDWYGSCQCERCKAVYAEEGGAVAGALIRCLNRVLQQTTRTYPRKRIITFAYMETAQPPVKTRPHPSLVVELVHWGFCNLHPIAACEKNKPFMAYLRGWDALTTDNLYVWHYCVNFKQYQMPWPNLSNLAESARTYAENGVSGFHWQGNYSTPGAEWGALRAYLLAKLMWDPGRDWRTVVQEFLEGYFGEAAAKPLWEYLRRAEEQSAKADWHPDPIFASEPAEVRKRLFPPDVLERAESLWRQAEAAAQGDSLKRVLHERAAAFTAIHFVGAPPLQRAGDWYVPGGRADLARLVRSYTDNIGTAPTNEWGAYPILQAAWLQGAGGPLTRIEGDALRVDACANVRGRIVGIDDRRTGRELVATYVEDVGTPHLLWRLAADGGTLTGVGRAVRDNWAAPTVVEVRREVRLAQGRPQVDIRTQLVGGAQDATLPLTATLELPVPEPETLVVRAQGEGFVREVRFPPDATPQYLDLPDAAPAVSVFFQHGDGLTLAYRAERSNIRLLSAALDRPGKKLTLAVRTSDLTVAKGGTVDALSQSIRVAAPSEMPAAPVVRIVAPPADGVWRVGAGRPFAQVQDALSSMAAAYAGKEFVRRETVEIANGVYSGFTVPGVLKPTPQNRLVFRPGAGEKPVIRVLPGSSGAQLGDGQDRPVAHVTIAGLTFAGLDGEAKQGTGITFGALYCSDIRILHNRFDFVGCAYVANYCRQVAFVGNRVTRSARAIFDNTTRGVLVANNVFVQPPNSERTVCGWLTYVINNTFVGGEWPLVVVEGGAVVANNLFINNTRPAVWYETGTPALIDHNLVLGPRSGYYQIGKEILGALADARRAGHGLHDATGDPVFTAPDAGDFTPGPESPAIDAGTAEGLGGATLQEIFNRYGVPFVDAAGLPRLAGRAVDLGAFEHQP